MCEGDGGVIDIVQAHTALARLGESDFVSNAEGAFGVLSDSFAIDESAVCGAAGWQKGGVR